MLTLIQEEFSLVINRITLLLLTDYESHRSYTVGIGRRLPEYSLEPVIELIGVRLLLLILMILKLFGDGERLILT